MKPSIGRIVLVQVAGAEVLPAIVLKVHALNETPVIDVEVFGMLPPDSAVQLATKLVESFGTGDHGDLVKETERRFDEGVDARFMVNLFEGKPGEVGRWFWPIREVTS